jgi:hypothetical protein
MTLGVKIWSYFDPEFLLIIGHPLYDYDVNGGADLPPEILEEHCDHWPNPAEMWDNKDRNKELRQHQFPANFMPDRRTNGVPDTTVGPWATELKRSPQKKIRPRPRQHVEFRGSCC